MIRLPFPATWLVPVATAAWAVWTGAHEHSFQREKDRARITALYVNPFLSACEDLQNRIHKILELKERVVLAQNHPADLQNYLDKKSGYSYFPATRKKCVSSMKTL